GGGNPLAADEVVFGPGQPGGQGGANARSGAVGRRVSVAAEGGFGGAIMLDGARRRSRMGSHRFHRNPIGVELLILNHQSSKKQYYVGSEMQIPIRRVGGRILILPP